jgi:hypothetical protein
MTTVEVLVQERPRRRWKRAAAWVWLVSSCMSMPGSAPADRVGYLTMALLCVWYLQRGQR